jgi:hypothetical protein
MTVRLLNICLMFITAGSCFALQVPKKGEDPAHDVREKNLMRLANRCVCVCVCVCTYVPAMFMARIGARTHGYR